MEVPHINSPGFGLAYVRDEQQAAQLQWNGKGSLQILTFADLYFLQGLINIPNQVIVIFNAN